jgi:hypothetical protein
LADNHPQHPLPEQINPARAEPVCVPIVHARLSGAAYLLDQRTRSLVIISIQLTFAFAPAATGTQYSLCYGVLKTFHHGEVFDSFLSRNTFQPPKRTKGPVLSFMKIEGWVILDGTKDPTDCEITSFELSKGTSGSNPIVPLKVIYAHHYSPWRSRVGLLGTDAYTDGFDGNARNTVLFIMDG